MTDYLKATQKSRGDKMNLGWMDEEPKPQLEHENSGASTGTGEEETQGTDLDEESDEYLAYYGWQVKGGRRAK